MNREIKFRGWPKTGDEDIDGKMWQVTDISLLPQGNYPCYARLGFSYHVPVKDVVLMQSTGLLDKQGKEIYEGDVLAGHPYSIEPVEVYWDEAQCGFEVRRDNCSAHFIDWSGEYDLGYQPFEVIGNIYEGLHSGEIGGDDESS